MAHFERNMGCIEIMGKSGRVERVYFEVADSRRKQWKATQIQESRLAFLHTVEMSSQKNKLKGFVSFCEDAIFEVCVGREGREEGREGRGGSNEGSACRLQRTSNNRLLLKCTVCCLYLVDHRIIIK